MFFFISGKELTILEEILIGEIGKRNKYKWQLESKKQVWKVKRKMWTNPASQSEVQTSAIFREKVRNSIKQYENALFNNEAIHKKGRKRVSGGGRKVIYLDVREVRAKLFV